MKRQTWKEWLQRDDRSWLETLHRTNWNTSECMNSLKSCLEDIVSPLQFNDHSRWGVQIPTAELEKIEINFLNWMRDSGEWTQLQKKWRSPQQNPFLCSLPYALSRSFFRFKDSQKKDHPRKRSLHTLSGIRSIQDFSFAQSLTTPILEAFQNLSAQLPQELRIIYQLHLEGLLNDEISLLLQINESEISALIEEAKNYINSAPERFGT